MTPRSSDSLDLKHYLISRALTSTADKDVTSLRTKKLKFIEHLQQLSQPFWKQLSTKYVRHLQRLSKWHQSHADLKVNTVVLVKHSNLPLGSETWEKLPSDEVGNTGTIIKRYFGSIFQDLRLGGAEDSVCNISSFVPKLRFKLFICNNTSDLLNTLCNSFSNN